MNEAVASSSLATQSAVAKASTACESRKSGDLRTYLLLGLLVVLGWTLREFDWITPEEGLGYWLGITGASLMGTLLLYPLRKRFRILHAIGPTRHWFRLHMAFGLVGPLLILYHCNFQLGSFNSRVSLYCMLLVAGSGIVGKHFYAAIHRGLYGRKTTLAELQKELADSVEKSHGLVRFMPELVTRLEELSQTFQGDRITRSIGVRRSLRWTFTHNLTRLSLWRTAHRELRLAAQQSEIVARDYKRLARIASRYIRDYTRLTGRVAQFSFYERLFALWHILHLPIFFMMVLSVIFHILAVHMY